MPPKKATATKAKATTTTKTKVTATVKTKAPTAAKAKAPALKVTKKAAPAKSAAKTASATTKASTASTKTSSAAGKKRKASSSETPAETRAPTKPAANEAKKRKSADEPSTQADEAAARPVKKARVTPKAAINTPPTTRLNIYVCGEGSSGELGLGTAKNAVDVKRPRLNPNLSADTVGVVQIAVGGMHCAALTHDNKILTWGVNDQGALGRDTNWEGGLKDIDDDKSDASEESDSGLNPKESIPTAIASDAFPEGTVFVEVAAGDSTTFALTDDGNVYGWGTFRSNEGILGFTAKSHVQRTPMHLPTLKKITHLVCGGNHVLALDQKGNVLAWGSGQQNQLGRRVIERTRMNGLVPREFGLPRGKITYIEAGAYHSFAIDKAGRVWSWGLNNYGETGIAEGAGEDDAVVLKPTLVPSLADKHVVGLKGGVHHSVAVTADGACLAWGRVDGYQMGIPLDALNADPNIVLDERDHARILKVPTPIPALAHEHVVFVTAGSDHSLALTKDGKAYSWGFSATYQTGQGSDTDVQVATLIDNTAVRGKMLNWAGAGGQFSVLTAPAEGQVQGQGMTNGA
ncbi:hypothetical protein MMC16_002195 [Acarospora aff. strigata]|nr:hypothetical protein [Acarospora aff. strigata]